MTKAGRRDDEDNDDATVYIQGREMGGVGRLGSAGTTDGSTNIITKMHTHRNEMKNQFRTNFGKSI